MKAGKKAKTYEMDMCSGPIFIKIVVFAVPLILSGILQLLFNAADIIVVGRFAGSESLAAVGSTSALINLLVNVFIGLSVGANVMVARFYGAGQQRDLEETVHTAMAMAVAQEPLRPLLMGMYRICWYSSRALSQSPVTSAGAG